MAERFKIPWNDFGLHVFIGWRWHNQLKCCAQFGYSLSSDCCLLRQSVDCISHKSHGSIVLIKFAEQYWFSTKRYECITYFIHSFGSFYLLLSIFDDEMEHLSHCTSLDLLNLNSMRQRFFFRWIFIWITSLWSAIANRNVFEQMQKCWKWLKFVKWLWITESSIVLSQLVRFPHYDFINEPNSIIKPNRELARPISLTCVSRVAESCMRASYTAAKDLTKELTKNPYCVCLSYNRHS